MAVLLGTPKPLPNDLTSGYQVFHRLATDEDTKDNVALMTHGSQMTFSELQQLVDSLEAWILEVVDVILKKESQKVANYEAYLKESEGWGVDEDELSSNQADDGSHKSESCKEQNEQEKDGESKDGITDQSSEAPKVEKCIYIALCMNRSSNLVALILAFWKLGWAYVPLDPAVPGVRTLFVMRDAEPVCVITDEHTNIKIRSLESDTSIHPLQNSSGGQAAWENSGMSEVLKYSVSDRIVDIRSWEKTSSESKQQQKERSSTLHMELRGTGKLACLLYTSGSTGNPKGVLLTMENLMNRVYWQWNEFPFKANEVCLLSKSLTFVDSLTELFTPLLAGVPVAVVKELHINPEIIINYVSKFGISRLVLVPSLLKLLLLYLNTTKDSIRLLQLYVNLWIASGEPIPGWLLNDFFAMFPGSNFTNFYGSTEVTGDVTFLKVEETTWKAGVKVPIGKPISNTALLIVKKNLQSYSCAKAGEAGEIVIIGKNVCAGYFHGKQYTPDSGIFLPMSSIDISDQEKRENLYQFLKNLQKSESGDVKNFDVHENSESSVGKENCENGKEITLPGESRAGDQCNVASNNVSDETRSPKKSPGKTETPISSFFRYALSPSKSKQSSPVKSSNNTLPNSPVKSSQTSSEVSSLKELSKSRMNASMEKLLLSQDSKSSTTTSPESTDVPSKDTSNVLENMVAYRTGDWGKVVGSQVIFEGRKDSQVKVRGVRVQLAEVDDAVHRSGYTDAHYVLAATEQDTEDEDHVLVAFVVLKAEFEERDTPITEDLLRCLRSYLPDVMVPRVVVLDTLPHLPSGKVDRQTLLKIYRKRMSHRSSKDNILILRKDEPIESRVLRIICSALGLDRSQDVMNQNFFALGGSSITSVSVVVRLRDLGLDVTLEAFLKANTIGEVVNDILKAKTMAEVMNFFCSPSPGLPSSSSSSQAKKREEEFEDDEDDEDPLCDLNIQAFHPDIPVCTSNKGPSKKPRGLRLALLHTQPLSQGVDKQTVIEILAESFTTKNPLDVAVGVPKAAHRCLLNTLWPRLVQDDLSFVVKDPQRGILGAVINTDFFNEPQIRVPPSMREVAALHETLEEEARHTLAQEKRGQRWVHNLFLATNNCLTAQDNVRLVLHLEKELLRVTQTRKYHGVFTVNSNPLNQLLCENYLGYRRRGTVRVASFWYEGRKPFGRLPHDLLLVAMIKAL